MLEAIVTETAMPMEVSSHHSEIEQRWKEGLFVYTVGRPHIFWHTALLALEAPRHLQELRDPRTPQPLLVSPSKPPHKTLGVSAWSLCPDRLGSCWQPHGQ